METKLREMISLVRVGDSAYENKRLWVPPNAPYVFGGQLGALALRAGFCNLGAEFIADALHIQFLRPVVGGIPVRFNVTEIGPGSSMRTVLVSGYQSNCQVVQATCRYLHRATTNKENQIDYQTTKLRTDWGSTTERIPSNQFPGHIYGNLASGTQEPARQIIDVCAEGAWTAQESQCIAVMVADVHTTRVALKPYGIDIDSEKLRRIVSIDNHIWFHEVPDPRSLKVCCWCSRASDGRAMLVGEIFQGEKMVATITQEANIAISSNTKLPKPKL